MRSLFPNADCFVNVPIQAMETLAFLQIPVPLVSPSPPPIAAFSDLLFLSFDSAFTASLRIEKLPTESALSKFFADVFPQDVEIRAEDFEDDAPSGSQKCFGFGAVETRLLELHEEAKVLNEEDKAESQITHGSINTDIELPKRNGRVNVDKITQQYEVMQFETPVLHVFEANAFFFKNEGMQILSKAPEIESLDMLKPGPATHCPYEVQQSFLLVEDIAFEDIMEQKENLEDNCSFQNQIPLNHISFPTLEVDEIALESIAGVSAEAKLLSYFKNIELHYPQLDNQISKVEELWGKKEDDISEFLSDHFLSGNSFGSEYRSLDNFLEVDLISLIENSQIKINSVVPGTSGCERSLPDQQVIFQEFHFLDVDPSQNFEALNRQSNKEPGTCSWMFNEDMNFKNFNNLVVSLELTLVDDAFKSLPVPVICDREKLCSFYSIIEGNLANLKPHPVSALDGIYLDWHLLEEDKHNCNSYYYQNIVGDMLSHGIDFNWDSFDVRSVVYDFVFSDYSAHELNMEGSLESKEFFSDVSISTSIPLKVESSSGFPKPDHGEQYIKTNSEGASLLFKAISQSNDLEFFLNAQKATTGINGESATRLANDKAMSPKVPLGVSVSAISWGGESITASDMEENVNKQKELLDNFSVGEKHNTRPKEAMNNEEAHKTPLRIPLMSFSKESKHPHGDLASLPETVVLVNTQNLDKEMIVSRRSTYQRILAIEKEGAQVVERDSDLPVDIIINSSICLVWYNFRNIGKKATALDEASSCLPSCIENVAANVLTFLSFNFSGCIMVFEGEDSFLSTVMEFSDGLYAAAASLGIVVQIFCSYSSESTDEIIMNSIRYATRGVFPRMPESETLAESFLTKFPSVNPLTAHAILSFGGTLVHFLECTEEGRNRAIQKYHVPDESIALLGALCKYGEREDSRSIMTDCSSSVSSGTDSRSLNLNAASKRKRWEYGGSLNKSGTHMDDLLPFDPANKLSKEAMEPLVEKPYYSFMSNDPKTFQDFSNPRQYDGTLLHEEWDLDVGVRMDPSVVPKQHTFQISKEPETLKKIRKPEFSFNGELSGQMQVADETTLKNFDLFKTIRKTGFSFNDEFSGQQQGADGTLLKSFDLPNGKGSQVLFENQKGEVIDLTGISRSGEGLSSIDDPISFMMPEMETDGAEKPKMARRLSFGKNHQTTFPKSAGVFSKRNIWTSAKDQRHNIQVGSSNFSDIDFGNDITIINHPNKLLEDCFKQKSIEKSHGLQLQENESTPIRATQLSNALSSSTTGKNSPWTMDFLNKIRDKSRLRHQSLPSDASANCFCFSRNVSKDCKRRSPSIIDSFKYQVGSTRRVPEQKKQKRSSQSAGSVNVKARSSSVSFQRSWTPLDKRARKTLSFTATNGERQTKLVWNDGTRILSNKFRNQI